MQKGFVAATLKLWVTSPRIQKVWKNPKTIIINLGCADALFWLKKQQSICEALHWCKTLQCACRHAPGTWNSAEHGDSGAFAG